MKIEIHTENLVIRLDADGLRLLSPDVCDRHDPEDVDEDEEDYEPPPLRPWWARPWYRIRRIFVKPLTGEEADSILKEAYSEESFACLHQPNPIFEWIKERGVES